MTRPTDPLYGSQWHLARIGDLEAVWNHFTGRGVRVVVYDDGVEGTHPDLNGNYSAAGAFTYGGVTYSSAPTSGYGHGTSVAGLIAAEAFNGSGGVGVAWGSTVASLNFLDEVQAAPDPVIFAALRNAANFDVMNNSWGFTPLFQPSQSLLVPGSTAAGITAAFADVAATGRGGLGTIVVNAAGNSAVNANGDGMLASRHVMAIAATDQYGNATSYSNWGSNILVSAPDAAVTTDLSGNGGYNAAGTTDGDPLADTNYTSIFGGTSAATPLVSGVAALMLEANPSLGWRDVHAILALSASHTGSALGAGPAGQEIDGWHVANTGSWNGGGIGYSADYGFGMVDALAAVSMAEVWNLMNGAPQTSANEISASASWGGSIYIPDGGTALAQVTVGQAIEVETVMVTVNLTHSYATDLTLTLIAPDGSEFMLMRNDADPDLMDSGFAWTFAVAGARTLSGTGTWGLKADDAAMFDTGVIQGFGVEIFGHAPTGRTVHSFTDDFLSFRAISPARGNLMSTSAGDWLNFAGVSGNMALTLAPGQKIVVDGVDWATLNTGSAFTRIATGSGSDTVQGAAGNDIIHAGIGADRLSGGTGNDDIWGGRGSDTLYGGDNHDTLRGGIADDRAWGGYGRDLAFLGNGNDMFWDNPQNDANGHDTIWGGAGNDTVNGDGGREMIHGEAGNDSLLGGIGADTLYGNQDNDRLDGADGNDALLGGLGADMALGGTGFDSLWGEAGNDTLYGNQGNDELRGADGADKLFGGLDDDTAFGGTGFDTLYGEAGNDALYGNQGKDEIRGADGADRLFGGFDADLLFGGTGFDTLYGEAGNDTLYGNQGMDEVRGADGADRLFGGFDDDLLFGGTGFDTLYGEAGNDTLYGNQGMDEVRGGDGADLVFGGLDADALYGGNGDDRIFGEGGNDTLTGGTGVDHFIFAAGSGSDRVTDFADDIDMLVLDDALWGGGLTVAEMLAAYASVILSDTVFDFGGGNTITLAGLTGTGLFADDILIA